MARLLDRNMSGKVVVFSDRHLGHVASPTPVHFNDEPHPPDSGSKKLNERRWEARRNMWQFRKDAYAWLLHQAKKECANADAVIDVGDQIQGLRTDDKTELWIADASEQAEAACDLYERLRPRKLYMVGGTPRHTICDGTDYEQIIADKVGADTFENQSWINLCGHWIHVKHDLGGSQIPHGRFTSLARERTWNLEWHAKGEHPGIARLFLRGHVHYHRVAGAPCDGWEAISCPAIMGLGDKYGSRRCSGTVDFGFLVVEAEKGGSLRWRTVQPENRMQRAKGHYVK